MPDVDALLGRVAAMESEMIEAQRQLTAIPALGPDNDGQGEMQKGLLVQGWLEEAGLKVERVDAPDQRVPGGLRPNLVARLPGGEGPASWVLSHLDIVPTGPVGQWQGDPFTLRVEDGRLYGRGVLDDQAGLVSSLFGLKAIMLEGITPPGLAGLIIVSDEETGSAYGLDHVLKERPDLFTPQDLIVVPDGGEPDGSLIEVAEKSILWLKVEVTGRQVHGSTPDKGINALYASARMMVAVREMYQRFPQKDPVFLPPASTFEPTRKEAGVPNINTIPGRDVFYIDCRVLPPITLEEVENAFQERFGAIAGEEGVEVEISRNMFLAAPPATSADAPIVGVLQRAIKRVRGLEARAGGVGGGTVAAFFRKRGLPAAVWMSFPDSAHIPDEYCLIDDLVKDAQVFALLFAGI